MSEKKTGIDKLREQIEATAPVSEEEEYDFSQEPLWTDTGEFAKFGVPGLNKDCDLDNPQFYISVPRRVDYAVDCGRAQFGMQTQNIVVDQRGKRKAADQVSMTYNSYGLFLYLVEHCICDFVMRDPINGEVKRYNGNPRHTVACFKSIKNSKFCDWVVKKINETLGWTEEGEAKTQAFRHPVEGTETSAASE